DPHPRLGTPVRCSGRYCIQGSQAEVPSSQRLVLRSQMMPRRNNHQHGPTRNSLLAPALPCGVIALSARAEPAPPDVPTAVAARPGAEGYGAESVGGRGGRVIEVTNLNDSGEGSFRAAVGAAGKRIVVFRVGGVIELKSRVEIQNPYLTIAG